MNKLSLFLLLALLSFVINETKYYGDCTQLSFLQDTEAAYFDALEGDFCASLKTSGEYTHCCMFEFSNDTKICGAITDDQYENIGRFKKYMRDDVGDDDIGIDCSSRFISFSLLVALALLL
jgi:hypothetical protein